jgi:uncharacterized zinc-type alcohol dehydrogenase-like protein
VVDDAFVLKLSDKLDLAASAPLLCAGITMYSPLRHWNVGPGSKVAVIGMGGLGHVGVKLAVAMGAEVTVLSQSLNKQEDAKRFGAAALYATSDPETFKTLRGTFDLILNTISADLDTNAFLRLLAVEGTMVTIGLPDGPATVNLMGLLSGRRSLSGTGIGGIRETQEMLDFCAERGITSDVEVIPMQRINEAYDRMVKSDVKYRFSIDLASLKK